FYVFFPIFLYYSFLKLVGFFPSWDHCSLFRHLSRVRTPAPHSLWNPLQIVEGCYQIPPHLLFCRLNNPSSLSLSSYVMQPVWDPQGRNVL
uniref:Uncharacterized protein n=1 Tax=Chelonoidis abingdonii TaxID=106734 RepID=A0A8C0G687_CHEAB